MPNTLPCITPTAIGLFITVLVPLIGYIISIERRLSGIKADLTWIKQKLQGPTQEGN